MAAIPSIAGASVGIRAATAAGSSATDATQLSSLSNTATFVTGANGTKGVKLPKAISGKLIYIKNDTAAAAILKVYPASGATINGAASYDMASTTMGIFIARSATDWMAHSST